MGKLLHQHNLRKKIKTELIQKVPFRWHMSAIMFMTVSLGLISNFIMLNYISIDKPSVRYPLTALISYFWFFIMIKIYMKFHESFNGPDVIDVADAIDMNMPTTSGAASYWKGGGGSFSGGGSSGSYGTSTSGSSSSGGIDVGVDDGVGLAILILGIILAVVFGSSVYVIWHSPEILSEVLIEVFLVARLGKTIKKKNDPEWMFHIFKSTGIAFAVVLATCLVCGYVLQIKCPETKRLSDISKTCFFK